MYHVNQTLEIQQLELLEFENMNSNSDNMLKVVGKLTLSKTQAIGRRVNNTFKYLKI